MICRTFNTLLMMLVMAFSIGAYAEKPMEKLTEKPKSYPDGTWLNIDGTVNRVGPNMFILDYGEGNITVEMTCMKAPQLRPAVSMWKILVPPSTPAP